MQKTAAKFPESVMENYDELGSDDNIHITSFEQTSILEIGKIIQDLFSKIGKEVTLSLCRIKRRSSKR